VEPLKALTTRRGARLLHGGHVVSEILREPGPTHSLFDVLAACAVCLGPGRRIALLGFGGGSVVAPLRAMGGGHALRAVDLSLPAWRAFRALGGTWAGDLRVTIGEASAWLRRQRAFDAVIEDLSLPVPGDLVMPGVCFDPLPGLIAARLRPGGVAVVNAFTPPAGDWNRLLRRLLVRGSRAQVVLLADFDHRLLLLGRRLPPARSVARRIRAALETIDSRQAERFSVRSFA
jgi:SAM-dependent methyltransferase